MVKLLIYGAGAHAKVIIDIIEKSARYQIVGLIDDNKTVNSAILGYPVLGDSTVLKLFRKQGVAHAFVALGNNLWRQQKVTLLRKHGYRLSTLIHPFTSISPRVQYKPAACFAAGVVIGPETKIGEGVLINDKSEIGNACRIGDYVHIAPGVNCGDYVKISQKSFIGMGTTILPGIKIGTHSFICVGSLVTKNIPDYVKVAGNPARIIGKLTSRPS